jgi:hypothetical protein
MGPGLPGNPAQRAGVSRFRAKAFDFAAPNATLSPEFGDHDAASLLG